jgi:hypothetical protein
MYQSIDVIAKSVKQIAKIMTAEAEAKAAAADEDSAREVLALIAGSPSLSKAQLMGKAKDWLRTHKRGGDA